MISNINNCFFLEDSLNSDIGILLFLIKFNFFLFSLKCLFVNLDRVFKNKLLLENIFLFFVFVLLDNFMILLNICFVIIVWDGILKLLLILFFFLNNFIVLILLKMVLM